MLGKESDIVIAVLGKEYVGSKDLDFMYKTIYFWEPETLNVQLSRASRMMIVIGDVRRLRSSAAKFNQKLGLKLKSSYYGYVNVLLENSKKVRSTMDKLLELVNFEKRNKESRSNYGIYYPYLTNY